MKLIILGDIHGKWNRVQAILDHELEEGHALSTGDLCSYPFTPTKKQKLVFCNGNHDSSTQIRRLMQEKEAPLIPLAAGQVYELPDKTTIAALPGIYNAFLYEKSDTVKYYTRSDVERLLSLGQKIDIFLSHEAPSGVGFQKEGKDIGREEVTQVVQALQPKIAFFGHHHMAHQITYGQTLIVATDQPNHSYFRLSTGDFALEKIEAERHENKAYLYSWERKT